MQSIIKKQIKIPWPLFQDTASHNLCATPIGSKSGRTKDLLVNDASFSLQTPRQIKRLLLLLFLSLLVYSTIISHTSLFASHFMSAVTNVPPKLPLAAVLPPTHTFCQIGTR
jgi:hypothetical protein